MKTTLLFLAGTVCLLPMVSTAAKAAEAGPLRGQVKEKLMALRDDLGLDANQKKEIREALVGRKTEIAAQFKLGKNAREAMQTAVKEHGAESAEATAAANGIGDAAKKRALLVASITEQIKPILTPDQLKKLKESMAGIKGLIQREAFSGSF